MTLLEEHHDEIHDEVLAAEIVRLQQELELTLQEGQPISDGPPVAEAQASDEAQLSPQGRLINTAPQTDFVDTSACYKYVESDDDCSGNGMLSYDEVTVDTNDEQFLFMVEDEVTVVEEEEEMEVKSAGNQSQTQQLSSLLPVKKTSSLRDHILSHSQHSRSSSSKQNAILNPYSKYASAASTDDDKSEQSDTFHGDDNKNHEILLEEEDNQSYLSYDEITVNTADLLAEMEHPDESYLNHENHLQVNTSSPQAGSSQNVTNESLKKQGEEEEEMIVSLPSTLRPSLKIIAENGTNGTIVADVLNGDTNLSIMEPDWSQMSYTLDVMSSPTANEHIENRSASDVTAKLPSSIIPTPKNEANDPQSADVPSFDTAWTNFGQNLINPSRKGDDEIDVLSKNDCGGSVQSGSFEASFVNDVELTTNRAVGDTIVIDNNSSMSQNLSIDEQIRLMQEEMLMSTPVKFQSPLILQMRKKVGDSAVKSLDPAPILLTPGTQTKSPKNNHLPVSAVASPTQKSVQSTSSSTNRSPNVAKTPERQKPKSPKYKPQQSPRALAGNTSLKSSKSPTKVQSPVPLPKVPSARLSSPGTSPKVANRVTALTQQSPKLPQSQNSPKMPKSQSPIKLDPPPQSRKIAPSSPMFPKSPVEELSHLGPLNSLISPAKSVRSPKNTVQESPTMNTNELRPELPKLEHPYDSALTLNLDAIKTASQLEANHANRDISITIESKKKKTKLVRKVRKKTANNGDTAGQQSDVDNEIDQEALDLQAQIDEMKAQIAALSASEVIPNEISPAKESVAVVKENRPPPMFNLLGAIESAATKRVQRLEETGGELLMQEVVREVEPKPSTNRQLSTSMAEMISQRAAARDKRLADGGEQRMRKVVIKEKDEYKKDFSSIVGDVAAMGRLTRLNEYTVEAVGQPKKPQEEWKSNGLLAIQWKSAHMSVIHDAAAAGNATKMREHTVSNFPEENRHQDFPLHKQSSTRMEKLLLLDTKVGEGLRKVDNFISGQKEHQNKVNSLLIKPMQSYSKVEDVQLPRQNVPKIDPVRNAEKLSKMKREALMSGRPMIDISASAAERAWERRARLDRPGTAPKVQEACPCPYCKSASPYQTFAYRELERKMKENGDNVEYRHHKKKKIENMHCMEHHDANSTDTDAAQVVTKADADEIEMKRRERQRIREERRKLQQAVAEAEAAIAKAAADAETAAILKKQLELPQHDDISFLPTSSVGNVNTITSVPIESAPSNTTPYSLVNERVDEWNHTATKPIPKKYKNQPPGVDSAKCTCTIM